MQVPRGPAQILWKKKQSVRVLNVKEPTQKDSKHDILISCGKTNVQVMIPTLLVSELAIVTDYSDDFKRCDK